MTAGKVMSAIKVDMVRQQQPTVPQIVAAAPNILDLTRARRARATARVCLFGAPDPSETQRVYDDMIVQQHNYMLHRYQFDMRTDRFVGDDATGIAEAADNGAPSTSANVRAVQQRLQGVSGEQTPPLIRHQVSDSEASEDDEETAHGERLMAPPHDEPEASAVEVSESEKKRIDQYNSFMSSLTGKTNAATASATANTTSAMRAKCNKAPRNAGQKPYDKSTRPITEYFRKSKGVTISKISSGDAASTTSSAATTTTTAPQVTAESPDPLQ